MAPTPSHRLKLHRAEEHLVDLKGVIADASARRPYPVRETFDPDREEWVYYLSLDEIEPPEMFPIVLGDFLFNVRSALDHLIVAIAPDRESKKQVEFPIFTADPFRVHEHSGADLHPVEAALWRKRTSGLPADCIAELRRLQPYETARHFHGAPRDQVLAVLSMLQNADKHRNLVGVFTALARVEVKIESTAERSWYGLVPGLKNGAEVHSARSQVEVNIEGAAQVGVGRPDEIRDFHELCETTLDYIALEVLPRLEPFLPGGARHHATPPAG